MALLGNISAISDGVYENDGTGESVRSAFEKVKSNFTNIESFLRQGSIGGETAVDYYNANVSQKFRANTANITRLNTPEAFITTGNITTLNAGTIYSGDINVSGNIIPTAAGVYNLGSVGQPFSTIYYTTSVTSGVTQTTDAGLLVVHANAVVGDQKDVGIFGNVRHAYGSNTYAFFGFQKSTSNFIYKITPVDTSIGNNIVVGGVMGNVEFGSALLSNTTPSTEHANGALIVKGGTGIGGNLNVGGNATVGNLVVSGNILASGGFMVLNTNNIGYFGTPLLGGIIGGLVTFSNATPASAPNSAAVTIPNGGLGVGGNISVQGWVNSNNYSGNFYGNVTNPVQPFITTLGTLGNLSVTGTTSTGALQATSIGVTNITATGNINIVGVINGLPSLQVTGNISSTNVVASLYGSLYGTVQTPAQAQITSLGNLVTLSVAGNINNFEHINTTGNVYSAFLRGTLMTAAQPNVTSLGALSALNVAGASSFTGNVTANNQAVTNNFAVGLILANTINAATIGNATASIVGTVQTATQPNITSLGTLTGLTVSGNTAMNNTVYGRGVYDNSNRVASYSVGAGNISLQSNGAVYLTQIGPGSITVGNALTVPTVTTDQFGRITALTPTTISGMSLTGSSGTGTVGIGGTLTFATNFGVTAVASGSTITLSTPQDLRTTATPSFAGLTSTANVTVTGFLMPSANISYDVGSATTWWRTFYGVSTQARYADLAEVYTPDQQYEIGTVVVFGGNAEITVTNTYSDCRVAGVISENPAVLMNSGGKGQAVALRGKVPVKMSGPVFKGDSLVTADIPGLAVSVGVDKSHGQAVFAKSLETNLSPGKKTVMAVIL